MAIYRVKKDGEYTEIANHHLQNPNLSLKAKGLLCVMLSLSDEWEFSISGLCAICTDGKTAVVSALNELENEGYFVKTRTHKNGKFYWEYNIFEVPLPVCENPESGFQYIENLSTENLCLNKYNNIYNKINNNTLYNTAKPKTYALKTCSGKKDKRSVWLDNKPALLAQFDFSDDVQDKLYEFFEMLADLKAHLSDITLQKQLAKLAELSEALQLGVVETTVSRGWKSLDYCIDSLSSYKPSFDTSEKGSFQPKSKDDNRWEEYKDQETF